MWNATARKWYNGSAEVPWVGGTSAVFWGTAGTVTLSGTQAAGSLTFKTTGYTLTGGTLSLSGPSITVETGAASINSAVGGTTGLTKSGSGILNLGAANNYSGSTTIAAGTLNVLNATGSATGSGPIAVNTGAMLGGTGFVQGDVTNGGIVSPGVTVGTLRLGSTFTQTADGKLNIGLASTGSYDVLAVTGAATLAGTLDVSLVGGFTPQLDNAFQIITAAGLGGTSFTDLVLPPLAGNLGWHLDYGATALTLSVVLSGDFNRDGAVDAADYIAWIKTDGTPAGYDAWREQFGQTVGGGGGSNSAPEPGGLVVLLAAISWIYRIPRKVRSHRAAESPIVPVRHF
jgi:autotransporter-associated beta strand protein